METYEVVAIVEGSHLQSTDFAALGTLYDKLQTAASILGSTSSWAVKLAFLLLYRRIFWVSQHFIRAWWVVLLVTAVSYVVNQVITLTLCGVLNDSGLISGKVTDQIMAN